MAQDGKRSKRQAKNEGQGAQSVKRGSQTKQSTTKKEPETGIAQREQASPVLTLSPFSFMRRFSEEMDRLYGDFDFGRSLASEVKISYSRSISSLNRRMNEKGLSVR